MTKLNKEFKSPRELNVVALIAILFVVGLFAQTIIAIINTFETDIYTKMVAGISTI